MESCHWDLCSRAYHSATRSAVNWPVTNVVQSLSHGSWPAAWQAFLPFTIFRSLPKLMSIESMMPSNPTILSSAVPFCLQSSPASRCFPMSWLLATGSQSVGVSASASVLPMNIQNWFPLGLTGFIFLPSRGLSRIFSNITVQKHHFCPTQDSSNEHYLV